MEADYYVLPTQLGVFTGVCVCVCVCLCVCVCNYITHMYMYMYLFAVCIHYYNNYYIRIHMLREHLVPMRIG